LGYEKLLEHVITVVENPSPSVLGFLVVKSAIEDGKEVTGSNSIALTRVFQILPYIKDSILSFVLEYLSKNPYKLYTHYLSSLIN
jgi:hypothetical protein